MYRALTWWMLARGIPADEPAAVAQAASEPIIEVGTDPDGPWVRVDGQDVSAAVRTQEVTSAVSAVARVPQVRARLIALQREIIARARAEGRGIVAEGRDIGTVVAPDAVVKVYLTASERARAQRRTAESAASPDLTAIAGQLSAGPPRAGRGTRGRGRSAPPRRGRSRPPATPLPRRAPGREGGRWCNVAGCSKRQFRGEKERHSGAADDNRRA